MNDLYNWIGVAGIIAAYILMSLAEVIVWAV